PAPADGDNAVAVSWLPSSTGHAVLYVQGVNRLIDKRDLPAVPGVPASLSLTVPASAGEPLFFTLLVDGPGDAGTLQVNGGDVPTNLRFRGDAASVLSGGHHGWFYGDWNGNTPFDPSALTVPPDQGSTTSFAPGVPSSAGVEGLTAPVWKGSGF